jgi:hypothetical protein
MEISGQARQPNVWGNVSQHQTAADLKFDAPAAKTHSRSGICSEVVAQE